MVLQPIGHLSGRRACVGDAIGDPDAAKAAAGHKQTGMTREHAFNHIEPLQMPDLVLGVGPLESVHPRKEWIAPYSEHGPDIGQ